MDEHRPKEDDARVPSSGRRPGAGELAEDRLRRSAYSALQQLSCEFRTGVLTLRGRLPSYFLKQVALAVVAAFEGVERIDDRVEVVAGGTTLGRHPPPEPR